MALSREIMLTASEIDTLRQAANREGLSFSGWVRTVALEFAKNKYGLVPTETLKPRRRKTSRKKLAEAA